jgi:hypothetical protein
VPSGAAGGGDTRPDGLTSDQIRQLRSEVRQRLGEAQQLRGELSREGVDVEGLDRVIEGMRTLEGERVYLDPIGLERLQASVIDGIKEFEFSLRRQVLGDQQDKLFLSGTDEVPEGFRKLVEEYYRALSRGERK